MVDSNLQRETILPSEKAKAYKMRLESMRRQAGRPSKENWAPMEPNSAAYTVRSAIASKNAEGYVDSGVKILIAVVIGALLLAGLYALFNTTIIPTLGTKITGLFNYAG